MQLTTEQKLSIKAAADLHVKELTKELQYQSEVLMNRGQEHRENLQEFADIDIDDAASDDAVKELAIAKVQLLEGMAKDLLKIKSTPYFVRLDLIWEDTEEKETIYIGKSLYKPAGVFSWVSPISTLRYADIGEAEFEKPDGSSRKVRIERKDNFLITKAEIVFMTHQDTEYDRQVVFQKHMNERKEFLLPEIVAELDKLQDQIIRSDPKGPFLISGPAGSGKTTLALHRVAYLVLTPEFRDYFDPERIIVFVSNQGDIDYFSKLLPELGIEGVRITTFNEWATLVVNSRYVVKTSDRFKPMPTNKAVEFIQENNPWSSIPPRIVLDEFRKIKQELISDIPVQKRKPKLVHPTLHDWYLSGATHLEDKVLDEFKRFLNFQKENKYLDEVDLVILIKSLEESPKQYVHLVIDEVQNWLPEQLEIVTAIATRTYKAITFIGDIRQKTKAFAIRDWGDISEDFAKEGPRKVELLKVYRNSTSILKYLKSRGYDVEESNQKHDGEVTSDTYSDLEDLQSKISKIVEQSKLDKKQVGILAKYRNTLERLEYLGHGDPAVHILAVEDAQGLEFDSVVLIDSKDFEVDFEEINDLGPTSAAEYNAQSRHLYYVAITRAKQDVILLDQN